MLIATVALIVARPLVSGEDPALSSNITDPSGNTITLMWFLLASSWSLWSLLAKAPVVPFGLVDMGLVGIAGVYFVSTEFAAANVYPARIISWEMLGMACCFFAIRQATVHTREQKLIFNALLATAFAVVIFGLYQYCWEMPKLREQYGSNIEKLRKDFMEQSSGNIDPDNNFLDQLRIRVMQTHIYSTFSHPNTLASFLALMLPSALALSIAAWFNSRRKILFPMALGIAVAFIFALWANFSRGAMASISLVLVFALALYLWQTFPAKRFWILTALSVVSFSAVMIWKTNSLAGIFKKESSGGLTARIDYWKGTWKMIEQFPLLGVGPGNFGNSYARFMNENALEKIKDPHNFALELWSSSGIIALLLFATVIAILFQRILMHTENESVAQEHGDTIPPWVCYLGGMLGLLIAFVLRIEYKPPSDLIQESIGALIRTAGWFIAIGVLENLHISKFWMRRILLAGLIAMLLNLCVSGSVIFASVMMPFWAIAALAWSTTFSVSTLRGLRPAWVFPIIAGVSCFFMVGVFLPLANAFTLGTQAIQNGQLIATTPPDRKNESKLEKLRSKVLSPLQQAAALEPQNPRWNLLLGTWYPVAFFEATRSGDNQALAFGNAALQELDRAAKSNRESIEPALIKAQIRTLYAESNKTQAVNQYLDAAQALRQAIPFDPFEIKLRFQLANILWKAYLADAKRPNRFEIRDEAILQAKEAYRLDALFSNSPRNLTDRQRSILNTIILGKEPPGP
ncbi:MAG: O-antigen ligase domain-containing protein [Planctomycetes bacterium]|nr:O-antigen ligase domain-containing protein [Planctomycetota bacterium]NBY01007.1 O-antigen ligase domain-containing protein [Planctomycetota bacterium]